MIFPCLNNQSSALNASVTFDAGYLFPSPDRMKVQASGYNLLDEDIRGPDFSGEVEKDLPGEVFLQGFRMNSDFCKM